MGSSLSGTNLVLDLRYLFKKLVKYLYFICCYVKDSDADFKWSFNTCIRSSQEPTGPISQKLQAKSDPDERCLNTADRFNTIGSILMLYQCQTINPINGCFKFKQSKHKQAQGLVFCP